jgi:hypothetical protein
MLLWRVGQLVVRCRDGTCVRSLRVHISQHLLIAIYRSSLGSLATYYIDVSIRAHVLERSIQILTGADMNEAIDARVTMWPLCCAIIEGKNAWTVE